MRPSKTWGKTKPASRRAPNFSALASRRPICLPDHRPTDPPGFGRSLLGEQATTHRGKPGGRLSASLSFMALPSRQPFGEAYATFLTELKDPIRSARLRAITSVNRELILLYW